jgi:hypothetical protein
MLGAIADRPQSATTMTSHSSAVGPRCSCPLRLGQRTSCVRGQPRSRPTTGSLRRRALAAVNYPTSSVLRPSSRPVCSGSWGPWTAFTAGAEMNSEEAGGVRRIAVAITDSVKSFHARLRTRRVPLCRGCVAEMCYSRRVCASWFAGPGACCHAMGWLR